MILAPVHIFVMDPHANLVLGVTPKSPLENASGVSRNPGSSLSRTYNCTTQHACRQSSERLVLKDREDHCLMMLRRVLPESLSVESGGV